MNQNLFGSHISIEVVTGGFILSYPLSVNEPQMIAREVFTSSRKLNQKLKDVLESLSTTPVESD